MEAKWQKAELLYNGPGLNYRDAVQYICVTHSYTYIIR